MHLALDRRRSRCEPPAGHPAGMGAVSLPGMQYRPSQMTAAAPGGGWTCSFFVGELVAPGRARDVPPAGGPAEGDRDARGRVRVLAAGAGGRLGSQQGDFYVRRVKIRVRAVVPLVCAAVGTPRSSGSLR